MSATGLALLVVAAVAVLGALHARTAGRERRERAAMLDDVALLFDDAVPAADASGLPAITGTIDGRQHTVRLVLDALTLRKLPVLWLEVTVHRTLPVRGPLTVLMRPLGTEFFSPDATFAHELSAPPDWPRPCRVSAPDPARCPDPAVLDGAVDLLREPRTKEVALGPRGARVVRLAAECEQGGYRAARRAVFGPVRVPRAEVEVLVDALRVVTDRAETSAHPSRSAS